MTARTRKKRSRVTIPRELRPASGFEIVQAGSNGGNRWVIIRSKKAEPYHYTVGENGEVYAHFPPDTLHILHADKTCSAFSVDRPYEVAWANEALRSEILLLAAVRAGQAALSSVWRSRNRSR